MNAGKQRKTENKKKTQTIGNLSTFTAACLTTRTARTGMLPVRLPSPRSSSRSKAAAVPIRCPWKFLPPRLKNNAQLVRSPQRDR